MRKQVWISVNDRPSGDIFLKETTEFADFDYIKVRKTDIDDKHRSQRSWLIARSRIRTC